MDKLKSAQMFIGIVIGAVLVLILLRLFGATFSGFNVGPIEFDIPTPTHALQPTISLQEPSPTQITVVIPTQTSVPEGGTPPSFGGSNSEPLREHYPVVVGEGIFSEGTFSDGMAPFSEQWLWDNNHFNTQRMRIEEQPDGCDVARYNANLVWISGSPGMSLSINGDNVGEYQIAEDAHGYIFEWPIHIGDRICAAGFSSSIGFHIVIGPDIYFHYDSYCYRGSCR